MRYLIIGLYKLFTDLPHPLNINESVKCRLNLIIPYVITGYEYTCVCLIGVQGILVVFYS